MDERIKKLLSHPTLSDIPRDISVSELKVLIGVEKGNAIIVNVVKLDGDVICEFVLFSFVFVKSVVARLFFHFGLESIVSYVYFFFFHPHCF